MCVQDTTLQERLHWVAQNSAVSYHWKWCIGDIGIRLHYVYIGLLLQSDGSEQLVETNWKKMVMVNDGVVRADYTHLAGVEMGHEKVGHDDN